MLPLPDEKITDMVILGVRGTVIRKNGQTYCVPAERSFYHQLVIRSSFCGRIETLAKQAKALNAGFDQDCFFEAAGVCLFAHQGQKRKVSGEPYAEHPIQLVERAVVQFKIGIADELVAALLHDTVEDTMISLDFIRERFGPVAAGIVDGLTKIEQLEKDRLIDGKNIDKFVSALTTDIRVLRLKIIDRLINLEDAEWLSQESRGRNCREALEFYVPLARLCGMMSLSRPLADLAFRKLEPERYQQIGGIIDGLLQENKETLDGMAAAIKAEYLVLWRRTLGEKLVVTPEGRELLDAKMAGLSVKQRPKTPYEADQSAIVRGTDPSRISDILMIRVVVGSIDDCFALLDIIHQLGIPLDSFFRDHVNDPKLNGYRSLHTAVLIDGKLTVRFQIRTGEMQKAADEGVLSAPLAQGGQFRQPDIPWLKTDWLRVIFRTQDKRMKIALVKMLARAKPTSLLIKKKHDSMHVETFLPPDVSPLEAAIIADPEIGLRLRSAVFRDAEAEIDRPLAGNIGMMRLNIGEEVQYRDYGRLLNNPLARLRFADCLAGKDQEYRCRFAGEILNAELAHYFLRLAEIAGVYPEQVRGMIDRLINGEVLATDAARELNSLVSGSDEGLLLVTRLTLETGAADAGSLLTGMRKTFPLESGGFLNGQVKASIPFKSRLQLGQMERFVAELENNRDASVAEYDVVRPPIIHDWTVFNPTSFNYSRDLALLASRALRRQGGAVVDMFLNPLAMPMIPNNFRQQVGAVLAEHIAMASLLLIGGRKEEVDAFYSAIVEYLSIKSAPEPLVVLYERDQMFQPEGIIQPLTQIEEPYFGYMLTELGHADEFIFEHLLRRFNRETRGRSF